MSQSHKSFLSALRYCGPMQDWPTTAAALRQARKGKRLTLRELGPLLDVSYSYLAQMERGEFAPSTAVLARWAKELGLRLDLALVDASLPEPAHLTHAQREALASVLAVLPSLTNDEADHLRGLMSMLRPRG